MKKWIPPFVSFCLLYIFACQTNKKEAATAETVNYLEESPEDFNERMSWWRDAAFGMFIHWGPYAVPAGIYKGDSIPGIGEWIMNSAKIPVAEYEEFSRAFNPVDFDADEWAGIAKDAGMKYIIITSKHHDGFALWDSKVSDYDIMDTSPFKRDILAELKAACDKAGIALGFYHSIMDWHHPNAQAPHYPDYNTNDKSNPNFPDYYENYLKPQVKELIVNYNPAVLWFDGEWIPEFTHEMGQDLYQFCRELKPDIIINNRVDKGRQGMQGMNKEDADYAGDFGTPEQEILEGTSTFDWESCMTMNDTWGFKSNDHNWKSAETLVHNLIDAAAKGGNYLLNVGPTPEGKIPAPSVERLQEIGDWLEINGEAIFKTEKLAQYNDGEHIRYTRSKKGSEIYVIALQWPGETLQLNYESPVEGSEVELLGYDGGLEWTQEENATFIAIPAALQDSTQRPGKYAWTFVLEGQ